MRVKVLGCSGGVAKGQHTTCLLVNDSIMIDAGTGAGQLATSDAVNIKDILLSHSHLDHVASICFLSDQDIEYCSQPMRVYCLPETARALSSDLINGQLWPEIEKVVINGVNMVEFVPVKPFERVVIGDCEFTPLPVEHAVPTVGFCLHGKEADMIFISDMISTSDEVYEWIRARENVKYFMSDAAFPDRLERIARISKHMTPAMLHKACQNLADIPDLTFYATHVKPLYLPEVKEEVKALSGPKIEMLQDGDVFEI